MEINCKRITPHNDARLRAYVHKAVKVFFSMLKQLGALDMYLENYSNTHMVQKMYIRCYIENNLLNEPLHWENAKSFEDILVALAERFSENTYSFVWAGSQESWQYWSRINKQILSQCDYIWHKRKV